ncbi:MAG: hypothetical protein IJS12_09195 [Lachnospiraceae bacterium]|nr:hypothetical protein [Lachnospiraceae bacterium]
MRKNRFIPGWIIMTTVFFVAGFNLQTINVHAYIDPSAVTYVIQAVAGVVIALGAALTIFRHKIFAFLKKGKGEEEKKEIHFDDDASSDDSASSDGFNGEA